MRYIKIIVACQDHEMDALMEHLEAAAEGFFYATVQTNDPRDTDLVVLSDPEE
jgi:hypothetical protein